MFSSSSNRSFSFDFFLVFYFFDCSGSWLLCGLSPVAGRRLWGTRTSVTTAPRLLSLDAEVVALGLSCPMVCGVLVPRPGIEPVSPALEGGFLTTGPPRKATPPCFLTPTQHSERNCITSLCLLSSVPSDICFLQEFSPCC